MILYKGLCLFLVQFMLIIMQKCRYEDELATAFELVLIDEFT